MFREMRRSKQAMTEEECIALLTSAKRGVLSVTGDDGYPYGTFLNHYYDPESGKLYFHSGKVGHRVDAFRRDAKASFTCIDDGRQEPGEWFLRFRSVVVFGHVEEVTDREEVYRLARLLSYKFIQDDAHIDEEIRKSGPATLMFALVPEYMTGKHIKEE